MRRLGEIIPLVDGIMVGRGDLSIEMPRWSLAESQKLMISEAKRAGKLVILATNVMESMIHNPLPTAAEVTDATNGIIDGADLIMTSEETAMGKYPVETVEAMSKIAEYTENSEFLSTQIGWLSLMEHDYEDERNVSAVESIAKAAVSTAERIDAKLIVNFTVAGFSTNWISSYKPSCPIIAFTQFEVTAKQLLATWAVTPVLTKKFKLMNDVIKDAKSYLVKNKLVTKGDRVVFVHGHLFPAVSDAVSIETF
jgi:Pyruvate kinase